MNYYIYEAFMSGIRYQKLVSEEVMDDVDGPEDLFPPGVSKIRHLGVVQVIGDVQHLEEEYDSV